MGPLNCVLAVMIFMICGCAAQDYHIFCQYDLGSFYFKNESHVYSWNIDTRLCTHLVVGHGFGVNEQTGEVKITDEFMLVQHGFLTEVIRLKMDSVKKILFTLGGLANGESRRLTELISSSAKREKFYKSLTDFLSQWHLDGVQIDWRYPARGSQPKDKENFVIFLEELHLAAQQHKFILMVAVLGRTDKQTLDGYNIPTIANEADFVNLMLHDERDSHSRKLAYNAPLHGDENSVEAAVKHWLKAGLAPKKLILSIPLFLTSYTMDKKRFAVGSACKGPGKQTPFTRRPGFMTYNEWCLQMSKWSIHFDKKFMVPFATRGNQWVSFEDSRSLWPKMNIIKSNKLGGAMAWTIDADDFNGKCGEQFSQLRIIFTALGDQSALMTTAPTTVANGLCPRDGFQRHLWDCRLYHECRNGERIYYECLRGQFFDEKLGYCRPEKDVECKQDFVVWSPGMPLYGVDNFPLNLKIVE
ncbi:hypothetical protein KR074_004339 [Drosophila pseudoananassae]|nr:hypothetical protein KR074_004339 [Drosophila pseudoananassae]